MIRGLFYLPFRFFTIQKLSFIFVTQSSQTALLLSKQSIKYDRQHIKLQKCHEKSQDLTTAIFSISIVAVFLITLFSQTWTEDQLFEWLKTISQVCYCTHQNCPNFFNAHLMLKRTVLGQRLLKLHCSSWKN